MTWGLALRAIPMIALAQWGASLAWSQASRYPDLNDPNRKFAFAISAPENASEEDFSKRIEEWGVDVNSRPSLNESLLVLAVNEAANHGRPAALRALLKHGANPNVVTARGEPALQLAAMGAYTYDEKKVLHSDSLLATELLLIYGADPNVKNMVGQTPAAVMKGRRSADRLLADNRLQVIHLLEKWSKYTADAREFSRSTQLILDQLERANRAQALDASRGPCHR